MKKQCGPVPSLAAATDNNHHFINIINKSISYSEATSDKTKNTLILDVVLGHSWLSDSNDIHPAFTTHPSPQVLPPPWTPLRELTALSHTPPSCPLPKNPAACARLRDHRL